jgi:hypothetical protein
VLYAVTPAAEAASVPETARALARRRERLAGALAEAGLDWCLAGADDLAVERGGAGFSGTARLVLGTDDAARLLGALDALPESALAGAERVEARRRARGASAGDGPVRRRPAAPGAPCPAAD